MDSCLHHNSIFEEKVDLEAFILPTKQVQKIDEILTIEFSDIKQEPISHLENYQKCEQANNLNYSKIINLSTLSSKIILLKHIVQFN